MTPLAPNGDRLRVIQRQVTLPGMDQSIHVMVAAPLHSIQAEMDQFNQLLWVSLVVLALILLAGLAVQLRWGLAPLRRIQSDLTRVENGDSDRLETDLPAELTGLANAMNRVLERDQSLIERSRQTADNLAHALKTPIAVIGTLAGRLSDDQRVTLQSEIQRMDAAIRHHLSRASAAGPQHWAHPATSLRHSSPSSRVLSGLLSAASLNATSSFRRPSGSEPIPGFAGNGRQPG